MEPTFFAVDPVKLDNPYEDFARLRRESPIYFHPELGQWFVFRYADVTTLFNHPSLGADRLAGMREATPESVRPELDRIAPYFKEWILMSDGEPHKRVRSVLHRAFHPGIVESLRPKIAETAETLLDRASGGSGFDVSGEFAFLLTAYVLADFLGVRKEDRERVVHWSMDFIDYFNIAPITETTTRKMVASGLELMDYTQMLLDERKRSPQDDFLGQLSKIEAEEGSITNSELVGNAMLLLLAGHIAVRNLLGNAIWLLLTHREAKDRLLQDPSLMRNTVEETLRFECPVAAIPRVAMADLEYEGHQIPAGSLVQMVLSSANRDETVFSNAEIFDITRKPHATVSFGHGPHTCLGAVLAREETAIALEILFRRMPGLKLDPNEAPVWYRNLGNRGPITLPVCY